MAQFAKNQSTHRSEGPLKTRGSARTYEGGAGFAKDPRTELFSLAVTSMWEDKYYESKDERRVRMVKLVKQLSDDPVWMVKFVDFLRNKANIRTMAVAVAVEYAMAGGENSRQVIDAAIARADEPAEILGYVYAYHGRRVKSSIKRGIGDGARRVWDEYTALKYDGQGNDIRMGDVLNICHVKPRDARQAALFQFLLNRRHGNKANSPAVMAQLPRLAARQEIMNMPGSQRREVLSADMLKSSGMTWENLGGWLPKNADGVVMDAAAWEAAIPTMGYFALLRNLRNFRQAGVSRKVMNSVFDVLTDPERVAKSRVLPFRFYTAFTALDGNYQAELGEALERSFDNAPKFDGRTLIMVDTSGSMQGGLWGPSGRTSPATNAALLASMFRRQCDSADVCIYATDWKNVNSEFKDLNVLKDIKRIHDLNGKVGHGTQTWPSTEKAFKAGGGKYDRVVILTDMQDHPSLSRGIPSNVPVYVWDLQGYATASVDTSKPNRFLFTGLNDKMLQLVYLYEQGKTSDWDTLFS